MRQHIIDAANQDRAAITQAATKLVEVLAREHGFKLPNLSIAEGNRLLGFIERMQQSSCPELDGWSGVMFTAAQHTARIDIETKLLGAQQSNN